MSVKEMEAAIAQLDPRELAQLAKWWEEHHASAWDRQIEEDLEEGRLDSLLDEVEKEYESGLAKPL